MRNFDRSGFKSSSFSQNRRRNDDNDRYHSDDKYRNSSANKNFDRTDFKKPRYDGGHSYQDRQRDDRGRGGYDGGERSSFRDRSFRSNDHSKNERSFRNHSPVSRERNDRYSESKGGFRSNDIRRRSNNMSPPRGGGVGRSDFKSSSNIRSRLAPARSRIASTLNTRLSRNTNGSRILRRNDLRGGLITKRSSVPLNRAKEYAKKIKQARAKLNESGSASSSSKLKSGVDSKSPKKDSDEPRKNEDDEDYLAIANDVNFDEDENESTGGKNSAALAAAATATATTTKSEVKVKEEKDEASIAGEDDKKVDAQTSEEQASTSKEKDDKESKVSRHEHKQSKSRSRTTSKERERVRKYDRIEYACIHCSKRSTSAQEYRSHLNGRRHLLAMRNVGLRVRATLNRLRKVQRDRQLEIEALIKDVEDIQSKYCPVCKLNFRQSNEEHRESDDHKKINNFLKPYCKICRLQMISPMKYEIHRCHTDHIRRKLKAQEGSDDEVDFQSMDIGDFKTIDSTGEVDEDGIDEEIEIGDLSESPGRECISKVEAHYCSLCHDFICRHDDEDEEKIIADHCKLRRHTNRYSDYRRAEERKREKSSKEVKEETKSPVKQNGSETKGEKFSSNAVDRDADVNLDENTNEDENAEEDS